MKHPWYLKLIVGAIMLILAFIGIVLTNLERSGAWEYWKAIVPIYAVLALFLSWMDRKGKQAISPITLWHELLHWLCLFAAVLLVSIFVHTGIISRSIGALFVLTLLSLTVCIAGVYIDATFLLIGLVLGIFAALIAMAVKFFYSLAIPLLVLILGIIGYLLWKKKAHSS